MTTLPDIAAVAGKLSPTRRRQLLNAAGVICAPQFNRDTIVDLCASGYARPTARTQHGKVTRAVLNKHGLALRQHLLENGGGCASLSTEGNEG